MSENVCEHGVDYAEFCEPCKHHPADDRSSRLNALVGGLVPPAYQERFLFDAEFHARVYRFACEVDESAQRQLFTETHIATGPRGMRECGTCGGTGLVWSRPIVRSPLTGKLGSVAVACPDCSRVRYRKANR